ncbi:hypothetical protein [Micromonospora cremea]|uniref:Uncharacterized protein n=1 Tax=Micromonospora cremea TaxID=709881 RepID=A0A1N5UFH2_9ACTN|nr:hypothetical protein [Micromonospora cremea]SIM59502.1 hypothetical protein SAMN04489832_0874 [Micromonospora cremea]
MVVAEPLTNISATAGLYSQIAGVLAGFAFTALLLYLNRTPDTPEQVKEVDPSQADEATRVHRQVTVVLFNTLGALIICAVQYGVLAGGPPDSGNSLSGTMLNGPAFSLAILGMFYATALAAAPFGHLAPMLASARILVGAIGPVIAMLLIASAALDIHISGCVARAAASQGTTTVCRTDTEIALDRPYGFALALTALMLLIGVLALTVFRQPTRPAPLWIPKAMAHLIIGAAAITTFGTVFLGTRPVSYLLPSPALFAVLTSAFAILTSFAVMAARSCHHIQDAQPGGAHRDGATPPAVLRPIPSTPA